MWKQCEEYPNIAIDENGNIMSITFSIKTKSKGTDCIKTYKEKILKPLINKRNGYYYVCTKNKSNKYKRVLIHRLVAQAFIPNPDNKEEVNHKNGIKSDNRVENLEWCSRSENIRHAFKHNLISKHNMSVAQLKRHSK